MDRSDLEREIEKLHAGCFGWTLSCCGRDREEAEEVLQTSYVKVLDGVARFDGRSGFKTWLFAVIRNTAAERRRKRLLQRLGIERWLARTPAGEATTEAPRIELSDRSRELVAALGHLSTRQRELLELVFYHDMTIEEAAATLRIGLGSARVHYERGKKRLREALGHLR